MRAVRGAAAVLLLVLATVLAVLAVVLSLTLVLLPVGLLVGYAAARLFKLATKLLLPRAADVRRGVRKGLRLKEARAATEHMAKTAKRALRRRRRPRIGTGWLPGTR
ncbi:hypothetical protein ACQEVB_32830 [Pseudonocardia sp. CA-107938]|uniref:hypothetical protein n=1 Tax=Pseudonocardia sp. CA-107938 TaxID=3240021 RepID=UPI003D939E72